MEVNRPIGPSSPKGQRRRAALWTRTRCELLILTTRWTFTRIRRNLRQCRSGEQPETTYSDRAINLKWRYLARELSTLVIFRSSRSQARLERHTSPRQRTHSWGNPLSRKGMEKRKIIRCLKACLKLQTRRSSSSNYRKQTWKRETLVSNQGIKECKTWATLCEKAISRISASVCQRQLAQTTLRRPWMPSLTRLNCSLTTQSSRQVAAP